MLREHEDGLTVTAAQNYTVADAVRDWLTLGLSGQQISDRPAGQTGVVDSRSGTPTRRSSDDGFLAKNSTTSPDAPMGSRAAQVPDGATATAVRSRCVSWPVR